MVIGCSGSKTEPDPGNLIVKGKLVEGSKPFTLDPSKVPMPKGATAPPPGMGNPLQILFFAGEGTQQYSADVNAEMGTFEVKGDGKGIPPGRYKIAITAKHGFGPDTPDYFRGRYSQENTKIIREIKPGDEIVIDVTKPEG